MKRVEKEELLNKYILEARAMSFYLNYEQRCEMLILFIKMEGNNWYRIYSSEGVSYMKKLKEEPELIPISLITDEFAYPIFKIKENFLLGKIIEVKEYVYCRYKDASCGFYFELENNTGFSIIDKDDCLSIIDGIIIDDEYELKII